MRPCCWGCGRGRPWPGHRSIPRRPHRTISWVFVGLDVVSRQRPSLLLPRALCVVPTAIFVGNNLGLVVDRVRDGAVGVAKGDADGNPLAWPVFAHWGLCISGGKQTNTEAQYYGRPGWLEGCLLPIDVPRRSKILGSFEISSGSLSKPVSGWRRRRHPCKQRAQASG